MSHSPIEWWKLHRNSPGMDATSKRGLLEQLTAQRDQNATLRAGITNRRLLAEWDETFAADDAAVTTTIQEIQESLT